MSRLLTATAYLRAQIREAEKSHGKGLFSPMPINKRLHMRAHGTVQPQRPRWRSEKQNPAPVYRHYCLSDVTWH